MKKYNNFITEIVNYNIYDLSNKKIYNGNLYYYSNIPITKEDLNNNSIFYPYNRADASDSNSEYIYQIKVKKPLYYYELVVQLNKSEKINKSNFSGYFYKNQITLEYECKIKIEDIISFKYIGGFSKYDKKISTRLDIDLSEEEDDGLYSYISGILRLDKLTNNIIDELKIFRPDKEIKLYKGIEEVQIKYYSELKPPYKNKQIIRSYFNHPTSWTRNILIAKRFIDDYPSSTPYVIEMIAKPQDILVDVQKLKKIYYHMNQREYILLPGEYEYKIIWKE